MGPGDRECRASGEILHSLPPTAGTIPQGFHGRPSRSENGLKTLTLHPFWMQVVQEVKKEVRGCGETGTGFNSHSRKIGSFSMLPLWQEPFSVLHALMRSVNRPVKTTVAPHGGDSGRPNLVEITGSGVRWPVTWWSNCVRAETIFTLRHQASIPSLGLPHVSPEQPRRGPRGQCVGPGARPSLGEGRVKNASKLILACS